MQAQRTKRVTHSVATDRVLVAAALLPGGQPGRAARSPACTVLLVPACKQARSQTLPQHFLACARAIMRSKSSSRVASMSSVDRAQLATCQSASRSGRGASSQRKQVRSCTSKPTRSLTALFPLFISLKGASVPLPSSSGCLACQRAHYRTHPARAHLHSGVRPLVGACSAAVCGSPVSATR